MDGAGPFFRFHDQDVMLQDSMLLVALKKNDWSDRVLVQKAVLFRFLGAVLAAALSRTNPGWAES